MEAVWKHFTVRHGREFLKHVLPAIVKPARTLWNEVIGFLFLNFAVIFGYKTVRYWLTFDRPTTLNARLVKGSGLEEASEEATLVDRLTWYATEVYVGTYDLFQPLKRGKPSARLTAEELYAVEPSLRPGLHGAVTLDEWGIDGQRLCLLNALSAAAHGAEVRTWTEATGLVREAGRVVGVRWRDALTGEHGEARAGVVVNATGGWSPRWGKSNGVLVPMRPGKGVHLSLDRRHGNYGIICTAVDGRQMFLMPHEMESIIGTTDDDYYGDPDDLDATAEEVEYLVEGVASLVPSVRQSRITRAWWGVRTTIYEYGVEEDDLSRDHRILDHAAEGAAGLLSFVGGKLASYRAQSEIGRAHV
jgi:glycerol-3-phosphate dehydrogenase